ncbi:MAG: hypothetical protein DMF71_10115 [Acidobacteria bacterium]|nr:MAG: hypothetical protein DMF71_10115 [Acidobacteriota bacterium]
MIITRQVSKQTIGKGKAGSARERFTIALRANAGKFGLELQPSVVGRLGVYYEILQKWNPRLHLVSSCSPEEFAVRHVLESLWILRYLPDGSRIIDIGSGGGLPIVPCLITRDDLTATLIESSRRKSVFLREALRISGALDRSQLIVDRFEQIKPPPTDFISCRALDRFPQMLPKLIDWAPANSTLLPELIPGSERRFLIVASSTRPS